ncbi:hypothetical protein D3C81_1845080 [compost metagenome]
MKITLTCIGSAPVDLNPEQSIALQRQVCRITGLLQRAFFPIACYRSHTDTKTNIKAERRTAARLVVLLGLLLNTGQHILKRTFLALITVRVHIGDIIRNDIKPCLKTGHRDGCTDC